MIRAIPLDNYAKARNTNQEFNGFVPPLEPVHEIEYKEPGAGNNAKITPVCDRNDFILVKSDYKMINLQVKDILYIEGKGNYVSLYTAKSKIMTLQTMKNLESFLLPYMFVRVHKSFLVSFHHVEAIDNNMILIRNIEIPIGDSYRESLRIFLNANTKQI
ncbi:MAG TPA: LytTR family DNA-binding domain-containing protein [Chitinophagaceae bacterium]|nr:LytTR family DNA-binding domain-containing protein [Chitinophagaceae bacterium]